MILPELKPIASVPFPAGVTVRPVQEGEAGLWLSVIRAAETLAEIPDHQFESAYGDDPAIIAERVYFAVGPEGTPIGSVAAWFGADNREDWGRIHWLYLLPEWQGRGLGRALVVFALNRLVALGHTKAYLTTSTGRPNAIHLYQQFGFQVTPPTGSPTFP